MRKRTLLLSIAVACIVAAAVFGWVTIRRGFSARNNPSSPNLWETSILAGQKFWIANHNSGTPTLYDNQGNKDIGLVVTIPGASQRVAIFCQG